MVTHSLPSPDKLPTFGIERANVLMTLARRIEADATLTKPLFKFLTEADVVIFFIYLTLLV